MSWVFSTYERKSIRPNCSLDSVCDYMSNGVPTPVYTNSEAQTPSVSHLCKNILQRLSHIIGLHFTGNSRYVSLKCVCVLVLQFHPAREDRCQKNANGKMALALHLQIKTFFFSMQYGGNLSVKVYGKIKISSPRPPPSFTTTVTIIHFLTLYRKTGWGGWFNTWQLTWEQCRSPVTVRQSLGDSTGRPRTHRWARCRSPPLPRCARPASTAGGRSRSPPPVRLENIQAGKGGGKRRGEKNIEQSKRPSDIVCVYNK